MIPMDELRKMHPTSRVILKGTAIPVRGLERVSGIRLNCIQRERGWYAGPMTVGEILPRCEEDSRICSHLERL